MFRFLLTAGLFAALLAGVGCRARVQPPGGATGTKPDLARKQAEELAVTAANGAAAAQVKARIVAATKRGGLIGMAFAATTGVAVSKPTDARPQPPAANPPAANANPAARPASPAPFRSGSRVAIRERVASSVSYSREADADEDALVVAADVIERKLAELDPPVAYRPTPNEVKNEFLRRDSRSLRKPTDSERADLQKYDVDPNRVYVEYEVEVTVDQVRELRTRDRVADALRVLGVVTAVFLAGYLFLLLDARTKGYLTRWLAVGAVALALGAAATAYLL